MGKCSPQIYRAGETHQRARHRNAESEECRRNGRDTWVRLLRLWKSEKIRFSDRWQGDEGWRVQKAPFVTKFPVVSGTLIPPSFLFKRRRLLHPNLILDFAIYTSNFAASLESGSLISCREDLGALENRNFRQWAEYFVQHTKY